MISAFPFNALKSFKTIKKENWIIISLSNNHTNWLSHLSIPTVKKLMHKFLFLFSSNFHFESFQKNNKQEQNTEKRSKKVRERIFLEELIYCPSFKFDLKFIPKI